MIKKFKKSDGVYLVMMAIGMVAILGIAGLAVDGAKLYRARLHLQRAADAGVIAGVYYRILNGPSIPDADVELHADHICKTNTITKPYGVEKTLTTINCNPTYDRNTETVTVDITANIPLFLMHLVPFETIGLNRIAEFMKVKALAQAKLRPARVALVLDVSNSMNCAADDPTCACLGINAPACVNNVSPGSLSNPVSKLDYLKIAVLDFLNGFRNNYDLVSLVPYNLVAKVEENLGLLTSALDAKVLNLTAASNTNPSDALARAYLDARSSTPRNEPISYILFSDGAPNSGRFFFPSSTSLEDNATAFGSRDYNLYSTAWQDGADAIYAPSAPMKSFLTNANPQAEVNFNHNQTFPRYYFGVDNNGSPAPTNFISLEVYPEECKQYNPGWMARQPALLNLFISRYAGRPDVMNVLPYSTPGPAIQAFELTHRVDSLSTDAALIGFQGLEGTPFPGPGAPPKEHNPEFYFNPFNLCLNRSFSFHYPGSSSQIIGNRYSTNNAEFIDRWHEQFYNSAIALSDYIRNDRINPGLVFTVGLGEPADLDIDGDPTSLDPYQRSTEFNLRKDFFLARTAMHPTAISPDDSNGTALGFGFSDQVWQRPDYTGINLKLLSEFRPLQYGLYLGTTEAEDLRRLFRRIRTRILLRLTR